MREAPLLSAVLATLLLVVAVYGEEQRFQVTVSAEPPECVLNIQGAGSYGAGEEARIKVTPDPRCRVRLWRIVTGGKPTSFQGGEEIIVPVYDNVEVRVQLERVYPETPQPTVVITFTANASGVRGYLPDSRVVIKGSEVIFSVLKEILVGEDKYVFLFWQHGDERIYETTVKMNAEEDTLFVAHFYQYMRFMGEYYPITDFVDVKMGEVRVGARIGRPVAVMVKGTNTTFPLPLRAPREVLHLLQPVYEWYYPVTIELQGISQSVEILLNGVSTTLRPGDNVFTFKEGMALTIEAPRSLKREVLSTAIPIRINITGAVPIALTYVPKHYAWLLDIQYPFGEFLFSFVEFSEGVLGTGNAFLSGGIMAGIIAVAGSGGVMLSKEVRRVLAGGGGSVALGSEDGLDSLLVRPEAFEGRRALAQRRRRGEEWTRGLRFIVDEDVKRLVEQLSQPVQNKPNNPVTNPLNSNAEMRVVKPQEVSRFEREMRGEFPAYVLSYAEISTPLLERLVERVKEKHLRFKGDVGAFMYDAEAEKIAGFISGQGGGLFWVLEQDAELAEHVIAEACRRKGLTYLRAEDKEGEDGEKYARRISGIAGKKRASVIIGKARGVFIDAAQRLALSGFKVILLTDYVEEDIEEGRLVRVECGAEGYSRILLTLLAAEGLLERFDLESLRRGGELASALGGLSILREVARRMRDTGMSLVGALEELVKTGITRFFDYHEREALKAIVDGEPAKRVKALFSQLKKQSGEEGEGAWESFLRKLSALGVRIEQEERTWAQTKPPSHEEISLAQPEPSSDEVKQREEASLGEAEEEKLAKSRSAVTLKYLSKLVSIYLHGNVEERAFKDLFWDYVRRIDSSSLTEEDREKALKMAELLRGREKEEYARALEELVNGRIVEEVRE